MSMGRLSLLTTGKLGANVVFTNDNFMGEEVATYVESLNAKHNSAR